MWVHQRINVCQYLDVYDATTSRDKHIRQPGYTSRWRSDDLALRLTRLWCDDNNDNDLEDLIFFTRLTPAMGKIINGIYDHEQKSNWVIGLNMTPPTNSLN